MYTSEIKEAEDGSGDAILEFPEEMIRELNWKEGDTLKISLEEDGTIILRKIQLFSVHTLDRTHTLQYTNNTRERKSHGTHSIKITSCQTNGD